jgi:hypothetical protein
VVCSEDTNHVFGGERLVIHGDLIHKELVGKRVFVERRSVRRPCGVRCNIQHETNVREYQRGHAKGIVL